MRSTLAPFYVTLERKLAGMLTRKPVRLEDVSDVVTEQLFHVDLQGNDLNVWTFETAKRCIRYGHVGVLVMRQRLARTAAVLDAVHAARRFGLAL